MELCPRRSIAANINQGPGDVWERNQGQKDCKANASFCSQYYPTLAFIRTGTMIHMIGHSHLLF